jgi:hypothetical protein
MKKKTVIWILSGVAALVLLVVLLTKLVAEPWLEGKIRTAINDNSGEYRVEMESVEVSVFQAGIELRNISVRPEGETTPQGALSGTIESLRIEGISICKALLRKDIDIGVIAVTGGRVEGVYVVQKKEGEGMVAPLNIKVGRLLLEDWMVDVKDGASAQSFLLADGRFELHDILMEEKDSVSPGMIGGFDFGASAFETVTADSFYTMAAYGMAYSGGSEWLRVDSVALQPNYSKYAFTGRHEYETDRFDVKVRDLLIQDVSVADYLQSDSLSIAYIEMAELNLQAFRDKREEFRHVDRPTFQEEIYGFPGALNIDSIAVLSGTIVYSEHAEKAGKYGSVWFSEVDSRLYNISNDSIYQRQEAYLEWHASALLMDEGRLAIELKSRIYDPENTFTVKGTLWGMPAAALNPILEDHAFITIREGEIDGMEFYMLANNEKATGDLELRYGGLDFDVVDKQSGEAKGAVERMKSVVADWVVKDGNPLPGKDFRPGTIEYERDPEKFLFNYMVKSLISGVKTSVVKE